MVERLSEAMRRVSAGALGPAEVIWFELLRSHPNQPEVLHLLADMARRQGRLPVAAKLLPMCVDREPAELSHWQMLGVVLGESKRWAESIEALREVVRLELGAAADWHNLGHALANDAD